MKYLISPHKNQYKANLHCHSVLSDGCKKPEELKKMYKEHGYSVLAITDHERPADHSALSDDDFIMLTGYECYIRPTKENKFDRYNKEIHLNLLAKEPHNVRYLCFNDNYCKYLRRDNAIEGLQRVGSERPREFTKEYINEYIRTAQENGYLVTYNHPYWSMDSEENILSYDGYFSIEICNYSSYRVNNLEYCGALYDKLLQAKKRVYCHGADDNHNGNTSYSDSFGAYAVILSDELSYSKVIEAMESGEMYASMGPEIREVYIDGDKIHIECSEVENIFVYNGGKAPAYAHANEGEVLTSAEFTIPSEARYVRVSVRDARGRWADTRGYFPDETGIGIEN